MLKKLNLDGIPCFKDGATELGPLTEATFIFGPNGSGKTSISRKLSNLTNIEAAAEWSDGMPMSVCVYNRDFADRVVEQYSQLAGVFLIGQENVTIRRQLEALIEPDGEKDKATQWRDRAQSNLTKHEGELSDAQSALTAATWAKRGSVPEVLRPMFDGYNGSREKFAEKLINAAEGSSHAEEQFTKEELVGRAKLVFDTSTPEELMIPELTKFDVNDFEGSDLLEVSIVGSKTSTMAALVEKLGNSDWVLHGRAYLNSSDGRCPFCQQKAPASLSSDLEHLFDMTYQSQRERLARFSSTYSAECLSLLAAARKLESNPGSLREDKTLSAAVADLDRLIQLNQTVVQKKVETPSSTVELEDLSAAIDAINMLVRSTNRKIDENNRQVRQRTKERPGLVSDCWSYFVTEVARDEVTKFLAEKARLTPAIDGIRRSLCDAKQKLSDIEDVERELNSQLVSSEPTIERMNSMLRSTGFTSFRLAQSVDLPDGYTIVRDNGAIEARSLSEGERTFLSFLYFYYRLHDRGPRDSNQEFVVVIDDPITSMDSDVMVVVSALIRSLIDQALEQSGRISQVIVLTHNVHFHREVTYQFNRNHDRRRSYFVIRKGVDRGHELRRFEMNPIRSTYGRLWDEVKAARTATSYESPIGLENTMRRILETYFSVLGNVGQERVIERFRGQDQLVCRSLYMWANGGSHSIFDDTDYSPSEQSVDTYLRVFRQIFVETGQLPHYEMMMSEGTLTEPPVGSVAVEI
ncbi:MAG: AAA family ATPase [Acidipropionibacterium acidipropionici]|jgi:wobble nucleotide-excising tRNase|uniref:AAA family ATPase n=1 Tax=Acidipropionibacterium acidipropionici TaxID=1748 RepID=UPI002F35356D